MTPVFFQRFLMISEAKTVAFILALFALFCIIRLLGKRKVGFSARVLIATGLGLLLGLAVQAAAAFPPDPMSVRFVNEITRWYGLFGNGFIDLIRMLVIPLITVSIINVIINIKGAGLGRLTGNTLAVTMAMAAVAAVLGLALGLAFDLGAGFASTEKSSVIKDVKPVADTLRALLPANPVTAMTDTNVIGLVIFAAFFGVAALRMGGKYPDAVRPFYELIGALHKIIVSVAMSVIKLMPYAVIALLANTIAQHGLKSVLEVLLFIGVLYLGVTIMFAIQLLVLSLFGLNPWVYVRKASAALIAAFTSRSSVGVLPVTIATLTRKLGVSEGTANFVAGLGSTAGMQGCAGLFPAMILIFVANHSGTPIDLTFLVMSVIVITIGSFGIAGIPGTATMAASVALSGTGLGTFFPMVSPILAVDPLIDMARTMLNVSGAMVNSLIVDKRLGLLNEGDYKNMDLAGGGGGGSDFSLD